MRRLPTAALLALALLAGCSALPDKPVREVLYDLGPGVTTEGIATPTGGPLVLPDFEVSASLEGSGVAIGALQMTKAQAEGTVDATMTVTRP